jgi:hypothetical protein
MAGPLLWLALYLAAGALVLWACYNSSACRVRSRIERNHRITSAFAPHPAAPAHPERVPASR